MNDSLIYLYSRLHVLNIIIIYSMSYPMELIPAATDAQYIHLLRMHDMRLSGQQLHPCMHALTMFIPMYVGQVTQLNCI